MEETPAILCLDHLVLTVANLKTTISIYVRDPDGNLLEVSKYSRPARTQLA